jgi:threonine dehydratase
LLEPSTIAAAAGRLAGRIHRTPLLTCRSLSERAGVDLVFKTECFQRTGSFKARGALNAVLNLPEACREGGVVTHSSGNHGAALAWAAQSEGVSAVVVMPENSLPNKIAAVKGYGAEVVLCQPTLAAREATLTQVIEARQATFIPPFDDEHIIAGQGTVVREILEDLDDIDAVIVPVGGGACWRGRSSLRTAGSEFSALNPSGPTTRGAVFEAVNCSQRSIHR